MNNEASKKEKQEGGLQSKDSEKDWFVECSPAGSDTFFISRDVLRSLIKTCVILNIQNYFQILIFLSILYGQFI